MALAPVKLHDRKAGAAYNGVICDPEMGCGEAINGRGARVIVEEHRGIYTAGGWRPFHHACHPSVIDKAVAKILA